MSCTNPLRNWALLLALVFALGPAAGCDYDDPDDGTGDDVDVIRFASPGTFRVVFFDQVFQSGAFAIDVMAGQPSDWMLGPGTDFMFGIDDDAAPYPHPSRSRKQRYDGRWDKRYWVQFAGGAWSTLGISVDSTEDRFRASSSPPSFIPYTDYMWCPEGRACMTWRNATARREARCFKYSLNGNEQPVNPWICGAYHPRIHWRIITCDDCPIPAVTGPSE